MRTRQDLSQNHFLAKIQLSLLCCPTGIEFLQLMDIFVPIFEHNNWGIFCQAPIDSHIDFLIALSFFRNIYRGFSVLTPRFSEVDISCLLSFALSSLVQTVYPGKYFSIL